MDIEGEFAVPAAAAEVWACLNDPHVLQACIPGCQRMTRLDAEQFECEILVKYGPLRASFMTLITLSNIQAPVSYTLTGRSQGGLAGFGAGVADVSLEARAGATRLRYAARLSAGGRISRLGSRLLASTTRRLAQRFFTAFAASFAPEPARQTMSD